MKSSTNLWNNTVPSLQRRPTQPRYNSAVAGAILVTTDARIASSSARQHGHRLGWPMAYMRGDLRMEGCSTSIHDCKGQPVGSVPYSAYGHRILRASP